MLYERLTQAQREQKLSALTKQQQQYIEHYLQRGKRTAFDNFMQDEKVTAIRSADEITLEENELQVHDWTIAQFVDYGENNRAGKCACGRALRYEFTVEHTMTKKKIQYGKEHLSQFLNIEVRDVDALLNTVEKFDYELDELLEKIDRHDFGFNLYEQLLEKEHVPSTIERHIELQLPLLDYQRRKLVKMMHAQVEAKLREYELQQAKEDAALMAEARKYAAMQQQIAAQEFEQRQAEQARLEALEAKRNAELDALFHTAIRQMDVDESELEHLAFALVQKGIHSATEMSRLLMKNFGKEKRFSIGVKERPYLYFDVLVALDRQVKRGKLFKDDASSIEDCFYYIENIQKVDETFEGESYQQTLF